MMQYWNNYYGMGNQWAGSGPFHAGWGLGTMFGFFIAILAIWTLVWKGFALWKASHQESKVWFIVLLVLNTAGILEILYLYYFSKKPNNWLHRIARKIAK